MNVLLHEVGNDYHGGAFCADGGTRVVDGEIFAGWGMISGSPLGRIFVLFGPVITNEAHGAFSGFRIHSNTAEMTAMFEALSFLGPCGLVTHEEQSPFFFLFYACCWHLSGHDPGPNTYSWRLHVNNLYTRLT